MSLLVPEYLHSFRKILNTNIKTPLASYSSQNDLQSCISDYESTCHLTFTCKQYFAFLHMVEYTPYVLNIYRMYLTYFSVIILTISGFIWDFNLLSDSLWHFSLYNTEIHLLHVKLTHQLMRTLTKHHRTEALLMQMILPSKQQIL